MEFNGPNGKAANDRQSSIEEIQRRKVELIGKLDGCIFTLVGGKELSEGQKAFLKDQGITLFEN